MRIILKILAMPFVAALFILCPVMLFVFVRIKVLLMFLAAFCVLISILLFINHNIAAGIAFAIAAFLFSPIGIPAIAEWLLKLLYHLNYSLRDFIKS
jgi:hypothetical protein